MSTSLNCLSDEQLCYAIARRHEDGSVDGLAKESFEELYGRYARWLLAYLSSRVRRQELEDVAQVVWQRVWERAETGFRGGKFQVWLYFIARNHLIDLSRRHRTERLGDSEATVADPRDNRPESGLEEGEQHERLQLGLRKLSPETREVVTRRLDGQSYETICQHLAMPKGKAYKLLQQAREFLEQWLAVSELKSNSPSNFQPAIG